MTINDKLETLYKEFNTNIRCGVVDEGVYLAHKIKIVFILKEAHFKNQIGISLDD